MQCRHILALSIPCALFVIQPGFSADDKKPRETVSRPMTEREKKKNEDKLKQELVTPYKKWIDEDVVWIISDDERRAFKQLQTDEEREQFIESFWLRRDPTPDTEENEYKEEHYRRIAYANERFASGIPGWKTDRGRIYIMFGPPDDTDDHSEGGQYQRPMTEGGGSTTTFPWMTWRYRYLDNIGSDISIEFVDPSMTGEFHITMDPTEKDALTHVPNAGLTFYEQMGLACYSQRFTRGDGTTLGTGSQALPASLDMFNRLDQYTKLQQAPSIKYKDLEAAVNSTIKFNILPMKIQAEFFPITESTVLVPITLQFENKDLGYKDKDGVSNANLELEGHVTSITRRPLNSFYDEVNVPIPTEMLSKGAQGSQIYQKIMPLAPGKYKLSVVAKDKVSGNVAKADMALDVPRLDDDRLSSSSLVLADIIEAVDRKSIGTGPFVLGDTKVRPRMNSTFKQDEKMGIYIQLYHFEADEATHKPDGTITYEVLRNSDNEKVIDAQEDVATLIKTKGGPGQVTIQKMLPLKGLAPGQYTLKMKVTDNKRNQTLTPSATFTVN
jgi:GWxTD domain-containing protein